MARAKVGLTGDQMIESTPKKTRQGQGKHTKYASTSRNGKKKVYRGQGK
jgi:DNA-binding protein H-NS|tara:strand:- start:36 stop:182 length:147 start_codon:yes stop_codon:yes gene_type:complete